MITTLWIDAFIKIVCALAVLLCENLKIWIQCLTQEELGKDLWNKTLTSETYLEEVSLLYVMIPTLCRADPAYLRTDQDYSSLGEGASTATVHWMCPIQPPFIRPEHIYFLGCEQEHWARGRMQRGTGRVRGNPSSDLNRHYFVT